MTNEDSDEYEYEYVGYEEVFIMDDFDQEPSTPEEPYEQEPVNQIQNSDKGPGVYPDGKIFELEHSCLNSDSDTQHLLDECDKVFSPNHQPNSSSRTLIGRSAKDYLQDIINKNDMKAKTNASQFLGR